MRNYFTTSAHSSFTVLLILTFICIPLIAVLFMSFIHLGDEEITYKSSIELVLSAYTAISTGVIALFTVLLANTAKNAAQDWKKSHDYSNLSSDISSTLNSAVKIFHFLLKHKFEIQIQFARILKMEINENEKFKRIIQLRTQKLSLENTSKFDLLQNEFESHIHLLLLNKHKNDILLSHLNAFKTAQDKSFFCLPDSLLDYEVKSKESFDTDMAKIATDMKKFRSELHEVNALFISFLKNNYKKTIEN